MGTEQQPTTGDHSAADPRAEGDHDQVVDAPTGADARFGERGT